MCHRGDCRSLAWPSLPNGGAPIKPETQTPSQQPTLHWNVFVAESVNGHAVSPTFTVSQATDHSNHTGQISTGGLTGASDRSLADFFQIGIDPNHLVNIAFADNHAGPSVSYFTRERSATVDITTKGKAMILWNPRREVATPIRRGATFLAAVYSNQSSPQRRVKGTKNGCTSDTQCA
jgi:hypothetical protein